MNTQYDNHRTAPASQLINVEKGSYFERTSRPIFALMYLFVFIIIYEFGIFLINPDLIDKPLSEIPGLVVAFAWVHNALTFLGLSGQLAWMGTPSVVVLILLAMQLTSKTDCTVRLKDFFPMTIECALWAVPLIVLSLALGHITKPEYEFRPIPQSPLASQVSIEIDEAQTNLDQADQPATPAGKSNLMLNIVTGIGAGIYEELVFRLCLICLLMILFADLLGFSQQASAAWAILISALLFSCHHHFFFIDGQFVRGEALVPIKFLFRTLAGVYLAVVFSFRGFGVAAATHVYHNIIAALMNAFLFAASN